MTKKNHFIRNVLCAFAAQIVSLVLSVLMSLIVPKLLDTESYAYWQLFIFYIGYVGFSHLGLTDGVYLKLGGEEYSNLDYSLYKSQMVLSLIIQTLIAGILIVASIFSALDPSRIFVIVCAMVYMLVFNAASYLGYIFQAVNETQKFSFSIILDRVVFIIAVIAAFIIRNVNFHYFVAFYIVSKVISLVYCCCKGWEIVKAKTRINISVIKEMFSNISVGAKLLIANIASTLILGIGRMVIDHRWGILAFGKISFSLSLTSFFLQFLSQISMVLFPALRQVKSESQSRLYSLLRDTVGLILPLALVAYYPMSVLVGLWLPTYKESLFYLAFLLPICTYDGKMQLLCNTYFKVLRKENWLLGVNFTAACMSVVLCLLGATVMDSMLAVAIGMVVAIAIRSIISELYLAKLMGQNVLPKIMIETCLVLIFVITNLVFKGFTAFVVFTLAYICYLILNRKYISRIWNGIKASRTI